MANGASCLSCMARCSCKSSWGLNHEAHEEREGFGTPKMKFGLRVLRVLRGYLKGVSSKTPEESCTS